MSTRLPNKNSAQAQDQKIIQGVDTYLAKLKTLSVAGTTYTPAALKALFQSEIDALQALDTVQAQAKQQVATTQALRAKSRIARSALKVYILGSYGAAAVQMLQDFGMSVPKPKGQMTADARVQAVAKAQATRKARHTMGKKQKLSIVGVVPTAAQAEMPAQSAPATAPAQVTAAPTTPVVAATSSAPSH